MAQSPPTLAATPTSGAASGVSLNSTTVTIPSSATVGQLMILAFQAATTVSGGGSGGITTPSGWTALGATNQNSSTIPFSTLVAWRFVQSGDPGSNVTVNFFGQGGTTNYCLWQLQLWNSCGDLTSTPVSVGAMVDATSSQAPTVTTVSVESVVEELWFTQGAAGVTPTYPATALPNAANGVYDIGGSYQTVASPGASTAETATNGSTGTEWQPVTFAIPPIQPPAAPTLVSPANNTYADLSGTPTFTDTYNPTQGDGSQNAKARRRKISGAGSYEYWSAGSAAWQSTLVFNSDITSSYTFPAGAWTNGNIYDWSVASQEGTDNLQGQFASDFVITAQAPPSVAITGPTGTNATAALTLTATVTLAAGAAMVSYQVKVYTAAQTQAGGFVAGSGSPVYDSGVVNTTSTSVSQALANLTNNTTYTPYVQVVETGSEASSWTAGPAFTVSADAPGVPTVTVTPGTSGVIPAVSVAHQGHDNLLSTVDASFEGSVGTWTGSNLTLSADSAHSLDGSESLKMVSNAPGAANAAHAAVTVTPGQSYVGVLFLDAAASEHWYARIVWYDANNTLISTTDATQITSWGTSWQASIPLGAAPSNAAKAVIQPEFPSLAANEDFWLDCAGLFPGDTLGYQLQVLSDSPVAYWPLTEGPGATTVKNAVGSGDGAVHGAVTFGESGPIASDTSQTAPGFDGSTGYIDASIPISQFRGGDFTVEECIYLLSFPAANVHTAGIGTAATDEAVYAYVNSSGEVVAGPYGDSNVASAPLVTETWHHIVYTYSVGTKVFTLWVDGASAGTVTTAGTVNVPGGSVFTIGDLFGEGWFAGRAAHVAVYSGVLSSTRILAHYDAMLSTAGQIVQKWARGGLTGAATVDVWARTKTGSPITDLQRPATTGIRVAAGLAASAGQSLTWTDLAAASQVEYEYRTVINAAGLSTSSNWEG